MRPVRAPAPPLWQEASTRRIATSECEGNCMRACAVCVDNRGELVYDHDACYYNFGFTATYGRLNKQRRVRLTVDLVWIF